MEETERQTVRCTCIQTKTEEKEPKIGLHAHKRTDRKWNQENGEERETEK